MSKHDRYDAYRRSDEAFELHKDFFNDVEHKRKIRKVVKIIKSVYRCSCLYVNHRSNKWDPFTAVKIMGSLKIHNLVDLEELYYKPLEKLGVHIVNGKTNGSIIHRVY